MSLENQQTVEEQVQDTSALNSRRYKFMTNILVRAQDKETYIKFLKKVTKDALVPTNRLIYSGIFLIVMVGFSLWMLFTDFDRLLYVLVPCILLSLSSIQLAYYLLISTRRKSMLASIFTLLSMRFSEYLRLKSAKYGELQTIGIKSFKKGFILFEDGDYGVCYATAGQLAKSTLPGVANQVQQIRFDYLVSRSNTSHEMTLTSIKKLNVSTQLDYYKRVYNVADGDSDTDAWRRYMSALIKNNVETNIAAKEISIYQYLIIRENDIAALKKSINLFELAASDGLYASVRRITTAKEFLEAVGVVSLISKKGAEKYVQKEEQNGAKEKFKRN